MNSLKIAVCDDEQTEREYLSALVDRWALKYGCAVNLLCFSSAEAFLFDYEQHTDYDVLLIDIEMKQINGIELAKRIRESNNQVQIIFVTGYGEFISEGYDVSALHYLLKPVSEEKLFCVLCKALALCGRQSRSVLFNISRDTVRVYTDDIVYAESQAHYCVIYTKNGALKPRVTMPELEEMLGEGFYRCSRSFIVSLSHISRITKTDVITDTGEALPLGKGQYDSINKALIKHFRGV